MTIRSMFLLDSMGMKKSGGLEMKLYERCVMIDAYETLSGDWLALLRLI